MEKYIAAKPVRFDRDYDTDEEIPASVIEFKVLKRLVKMGKISVVTAPGEEPPNDLLSKDPEQNITFIETVFNITCDESLSLEERVEVCKTVIAEIRQAIEDLKTADDEQQDDGDSEGSFEKIDTNTPADGEQPPAETQGATAGGEENNGDINNAGSETTQETEQGDTTTPDSQTDGAAAGTESGQPQLTCPVCNKVCATKSALAAHIKTHDKT